MKLSKTVVFCYKLNFMDYYKIIYNYKERLVNIFDIHYMMVSLIYRFYYVQIIFHL